MVTLHPIQQTMQLVSATCNHDAHIEEYIHTNFAELKLKYESPYSIIMAGKGGGLIQEKFLKQGLTRCTR